MLKHVILLFLVFQTLYLTAQPPRNDLKNMRGNSTPKPTKIKKPKIKYEFHYGYAVLKTGLRLEGKFKYVELKGEVPQYLFIENDTKMKRYVALSMMDKMLLAGSEKGITARADSTEFEWIDKYKDLYRKVRGGTIELFDNSRIVDEKYEYLTDYILLAGRQDYGHKNIEILADLDMFMTDRPYFLQSARVTSRLKTKDFRVIIYLVDLYNDKNPMKNLKWTEAEVVLRNGKKLTGNAYIQPLDLRNEYTSSNQASVHFHDGKDFQLLTGRSIKKLTLGGEVYEKGLYSAVNKEFYGKPWTHEKEKYLVVYRITNGNSYFFKPRHLTGKDLVLLENIADSYMKPRNESELRRAYIEELKQGQVLERGK
ncbi:MAG: hypothetical protein ACPG5B_05555 [Chitinophagales bacterium]